MGVSLHGKDTGLTLLQKLLYDFYQAQSLQVQNKIEWTQRLIEMSEIVPEKYLKHITGTAFLTQVVQSFKVMAKLLTTLDEHIEQNYGKRDTKKREEFERGYKIFEQEAFAELEKEQKAKLKKDVFPAPHQTDQVHALRPY